MKCTIRGETKGTKIILSVTIGFVTLAMCELLPETVREFRKWFQRREAHLVEAGFLEAEE